MSQIFQLKINEKIKKTAIIHSTNYITKYLTTKQLINKINSTSKKLLEIGYIKNQILEKITASTPPSFHLETK